MGKYKNMGPQSMDPLELCGLYPWTRTMKIWVYLGVRTCELFLCFVAIVRVRVCYVDFFVFFVTGEFHRFLHRGRAKNMDGSMDPLAWTGSMDPLFLLALKLVLIVINDYEFVLCL